MIEFNPFPKMARLNRDIVVTEKIDGTNAQVYITEDGELLVGSRTRWITPEQDNFGFAAWCRDNKEDLLKLGPGSHFGEWWGKGIQRGYGLDIRKFSLFNTHRWYDHSNHTRLAPECCEVVPVLYMGPFNEQSIKDEVDTLARHGSRAAPRYSDPEGVVIFHTAANAGFKITCKDDEKPKGQVN